MSKMFPALCALTVASMLVVPTVSQAATSTSVQVSYADLNLASDAGRNVLERRVARAVRIVCPTEDMRDFAIAHDTQACRSTATANAQPAVDAAIAAVRKGSVTVLDAAALTISAQ